MVAKVSWVPPTNTGGAPITQYDLQRSRDNGSTYSSVYTGPNLTYTDTTSVVNDFYRVRASNGTFWADAYSSVTAYVIAMSTASQEVLPVGAGGWLVDMDIAPDGTLYAAADVYTGYRLDPGATTWKDVITTSTIPAFSEMHHLEKGVSGFACAPSDSNVVYAMWHEYLLKSTNKAASWSYAVSGLTNVNSNSTNAKLTGPRIAVDPQNVNRVYMGTYDAGLWYTNDAWATTVKVPAATIPFGLTEGGEYVGVSSIVIDPYSTLVNGIRSRGYFNVHRGGIWRSDNLGDATPTFTKISDLTAVQMVVAGNRDLLLITQAADGNQSRFGQTTGTVRRFVPATSVWTDITPASNTWVAIAVDPQSTSRVVVLAQGLMDNAVAISDDTGATWTRLPRSPVTSDTPWHAWFINNAYSGGGQNWMSVASARFDTRPAFKGRVWVSEGIGMWYSDMFPNNVKATSTNWKGLSQGIEELVANDIVVINSGNTVITAGWDRANFIVSAAATTPATTVSGDANFNDSWALGTSVAGTLVASAVTNHFDWNPARAGYFTDNGATYTPYPSRPYNSTSAYRKQVPGTNTIAADNYEDQYGTPFGAGQIVVSGDDNHVWNPQQPAGTVRYPPHVTKDRGVSWTPCNFIGLAAQGVPAPRYAGDVIGGYGEFQRTNNYARDARLFERDSVTPGVFYALAKTQGFWKSTDGGSNWNQTGTAATLFSNDVYTYEYAPRLHAVPGNAGHLVIGNGRRDGANGDRTFDKTAAFRRTTDGGTSFVVVPGITSVEGMGFGKARTGATYPMFYAAGWVSGVWGLYCTANLNAANPTWELISKNPGGRMDRMTAIRGDMATYGRYYIGHAGSGWLRGMLDGTTPTTPTTPPASNTTTYTVNWTGDPYGASGSAGAPTMSDQGTFWRATSTVAGQSGVIPSMDFTAIAGRTYTITLPVKRGAGTARSVYFAVNHSQPEAGNYFNGSFSSPIVTVTDAFQDLAVTFTIPAASNSTSMTLRPIVTNGAIGDAIDWSKSVTVALAPVAAAVAPSQSDSPTVVFE